MGWIIAAYATDAANAPVVGYWNGIEIVLVSGGSDINDSQFFPIDGYPAPVMRREEAALQDRFAEEYNIEMLAANQVLTLAV